MRLLRAKASCIVLATTMLLSTAATPAQELVQPGSISQEPFPYPAGFSPEELISQSSDQANAKSYGCVQCHHGAKDMHDKSTVHLGCVDCHGGNASAATKECAHVPPRFPDAWPTSANPVRSYTLL